MAAIEIKVSANERGEPQVSISILPHSRSSRNVLNATRTTHRVRTKVPEDVLGAAMLQAEGVPLRMLQAFIQMGFDLGRRYEHMKILWKDRKTS